MHVCCDGCGSAMNSEAAMLLTKQVSTFGEQAEEHFHGWECLAIRATNVVGKRGQR